MRIRTANARHQRQLRAQDREYRLLKFAKRNQDIEAICMNGTEGEYIFLTKPLPESVNPDSERLKVAYERLCHKINNFMRVVSLDFQILPFSGEYPERSKVLYRKNSN